MSDPFVTMNRGKKLTFTEREKVDMAWELYIHNFRSKDEPLDSMVCLQLAESFIDIAQQRLEEE